MPTTKLFVYGTLLPGQRNAHYLKGLVGREAHTTPRYLMLDLGSFPGVIAAPAGGGVRGMIFEVPPEQLAAIDRLEGHPHFYRRQPIEMADGETGVEGYLLERPQRDVRCIPHGDWRRW